MLLVPEEDQVKGCTNKPLKNLNVSVIDECDCKNLT
jgi:hypothetical protein